MDAPKRETAEEQLLRLIEGAQSPKPQVAGSAPMSAPPDKESLRNRLIQSWQQAIAAARLRVSHWMRFRQRGDAVLQQLQLAIRALWLVLLALALYLGFAIARDHFHSRAPSLAAGAKSQTAAVTKAPPSPDTLMKPMAEYLSAVLQRNPFTGVSGSTAAAPVVRARERLKELTSSLVVVGIDRGPKPEALIEDKSEGRTHFVKVGDVINGAFVKEISSRGVVVEYGGEEQLLQ